MATGEKITHSFFCAVLGFFIALPIIILGKDILTLKDMFMVFTICCLLSFLISYFFPKTFAVFINLFSHITFF